MPKSESTHNLWLYSTLLTFIYPLGTLSPFFCISRYHSARRVGTVSDSGRKNTYQCHLDTYNVSADMESFSFGKTAVKVQDVLNKICYVANDAATTFPTCANNERKNLLGISHSWYNAIDEFESKGHKKFMKNKNTMKLVARFGLLRRSDSEYSESDPSDLSDPEYLPSKSIAIDEAASGIDSEDNNSSPPVSPAPKPSKRERSRESESARRSKKRRRSSSTTMTELSTVTAGRPSSLSRSSSSSSLRKTRTLGKKAKRAKGKSGKRDYEPSMQMDTNHLEDIARPDDLILPQEDAADFNIRLMNFYVGKAQPYAFEWDDLEPGGKEYGQRGATNISNLMAEKLQENPQSYLTMKKNLRVVSKNMTKDQLESLPRKMWTGPFLVQSGGQHVRGVKLAMKDRATRTILQRDMFRPQYDLYAGKDMPLDLWQRLVTETQASEEVYSKWRFMDLIEVGRCHLQTFNKMSTDSKLTDAEYQILHSVFTDLKRKESLYAPIRMMRATEVEFQMMKKIDRMEQLYELADMPRRPSDFHTPERQVRYNF